MTGRESRSRWVVIALVVLVCAIALWSSVGPPWRDDPATDGPGTTSADRGVAPRPGAARGERSPARPPAGGEDGRDQGPGPGAAGPGSGLDGAGTPATRAVVRHAAGVADQAAQPHGDPATGVAGRVLGADGASLADARVQLVGSTAPPEARRVIVMTADADGVLHRQVPGEVRSGEVTTDSSGRFEVLGLDPDVSYTIQVVPPPTAEALLRREVPAPALRRGEITDAGDLRLSEGATIAGRVVDPSGRPVAGARVQLSSAGGLAGLGSGRRMAVVRAVKGGGAGPLLGPGAQTTESDVDGRFRFARVEPGAKTVTAALAGFRSARHDVSLEAGTAAGELVLRLGEPLALRVVVRTTEGHPIAGARVRAGETPFPGPEEQGVETDAAGEALLSGLASSELTLLVSAEGYAPVTAQVRAPAGSTGRYEVALSPATTLSGLVLRAGDRAPVTDGFVLLLAVQHGRSVQVQAGDDNRLDGEGRFRLQGIAPGAYRLHVNAPGFAQRSELIEVGSEPVDVGALLVDPLTSLDVTVLDPEGAPVPGATASVEAGAAVMRLSMEAATSAAPRTDAAGRVTLPGVSPGRVTVRASKSGFAEGRADVEVGEGGAQVTVRLAAGGTVEATLMGSDGAPRPRAEVHLLRRGEPAPARSATTDERGEVRFDHVPAGAYALSASTRPDAPTAEWFTVADGVTVRRTLTQPATATLTGTLLRADGAPLAGATVRFGLLDPWHPGWRDPEVVFPLAATTSGASGGYRLEGLPLGDYGLTVVSGGDRVSYRVTVRDGDQVRDLRWPVAQAGVRVSARVEQDGAPVAGARVVLERIDDGPTCGRAAQTDASGAAQLDGIPAGTYRLAAEAAGTAREEATIEVGSAPVLAPLLELRPGVGLRLEVRSTRDLEGVFARLTRVGGGEVFTVVLGAGASTPVTGLRPETDYRLEVRAPGRPEHVEVVRGQPEPYPVRVIDLD